MSARPSQGALVGYQGHYAGAVTRFAAYSIDMLVTTAVFALGLAAISWGVRVVTGHDVSWNRSNAVVAVIYVAWQFLYFGYCWAAGGKTPGMALLGVRVVRADGTEIDPWRGVVRALAFPLSIIVFGLGFAGILLQRERRALHDLIAGTAVVYAGDARRARLRSVARAARRSPPVL